MNALKVNLFAVGTVNIYYNLYSSEFLPKNENQLFYWVATGLALVLVLISAVSVKLENALFVAALLILAKMMTQIYDQSKNQQNVLNLSLLCILVLFNINFFDKITIFIRGLRFIAVLSFFSIQRFSMSHISTSRNIVLVFLQTAIFYAFEKMMNFAYKKYIFYSSQKKQNHVKFRTALDRLSDPVILIQNEKLDYINDNFLEIFKDLVFQYQKNTPSEVTVHKESRLKRLMKYWF